MIYSIVGLISLRHPVDAHDLSRMLEGGDAFFNKVWDVPVDLSNLVVTIPPIDSTWFESGQAVAVIKGILLPLLSERIECNSWEFGVHCKYVKNLHDESRRWAFNSQLDMTTQQDPFPEVEVFLSTYRASDYEGEVRVAEATDAFLTDAYAGRIASGVVNQFKDIIKRFQDNRGITQLMLDFGPEAHRKLGVVVPTLKIEVTE